MTPAYAAFIDKDKGEFAMPLTQIWMRCGKPLAFRRSVMEQIYQAMRETFDVPEDDRFMTVMELDGDNFDFGRSYLGIERSDDFMIIRITANNTRSVDQKKALYARIAGRLAENVGVRPEDVFISLVEVPKENWSFGLGVAQYA